VFDGFTLPAAPHRMSYTFSQNVGASIDPSDLMLVNTTTSTTVPTANIAVSYNAGTNTATFTFPGYPNGVLPNGQYTATLLAAGVNNGSQTLPANVVSNFFVLAGDANHDATVNLLDFNILAGNFGLSGKIFSQGDFNYDGTVNLLDFNILSGNFGTSVGPSSVSGTNGGLTTATRTTTTGTTSLATFGAAPVRDSQLEALLGRDSGDVLALV
jgi:hypothetical protein